MPGLDPAKLDVFPAFHRVGGRCVLIAGNGAAATAKLRLLAETSARPVVLAADPEPGLVAAITDTGAELRRRALVDADLTGAALLFVAVTDGAEEDRIVTLARAAGVPVNVVDRPAACDFIVPALVNRAPVAVAISTAGTAPVLARLVRARIEAALPDGLGRIAALAARLRDQVSARLPDANARRRFWATLFTGAPARFAAAGRPLQAEAAAHQLLASAEDARPGFVSLVGAGPGAADLLTLRALSALQDADVIVHDRLVPDAIIALGRREAERISVGKAKGAHSVPQEEINALLVRLAQAGRRVVRLKSGDPLVFGRAGEEIAALRAAGIPHEVVPGISAAFAAAASLSLPQTLRGVASHLVLATGHDRDGRTFPDWGGLVLSGATVAVYMGGSVAGRVAARLMEGGLGAATPVVAIENASRADERVFAGALRDLAALAERTDLTGPVLFVIGSAVAAADLSTAIPLRADLARAA